MSGPVCDELTCTVGREGDGDVAWSDGHLTAGAEINHHNGIFSTADKL